MICPYTIMEEDHNNNGVVAGGGGCIKRERTAAELRKSNKPLMERKRRERINNCLQQLKSILMEVTKKESSYYSKLEKADILEMTVKYLKNMKQNQLSAAMTTDPAVLGKYIAGYNECTTEISKYLATLDGLTTDTRSRLLNHLANSLQRNSISMATNMAVSNIQQSMGQTATATQPQQPMGGLQIPAATQLSTLPGSAGVSVLNQASPAVQAIPASAMQLVPAKLPSGDLVFLLANQQTVSQQNNSVSVVSTVQNNVNNINIGQGGLGPAVTVNNVATVNALPQPQFTLPATMSPIVLCPKGLESPTGSSIPSTSSSSPESDISETSMTSQSSMASRRSLSSLDTPVRRHCDVIRHAPMSSGLDTDSSSDSDDDVNNNYNPREASVIRGPMWRPW